MRRPLTRCFTVLLCLLTMCVSASAQGVVESFEKGRIDWACGVVTAEGAYVPLEKNDGVITTEAQKHYENRAMGAARANLSAILRKLTIHGTTTGGDVMGNNSEILAQIDLIFLSTPITGKRFLTDGSVEVSMTLPLRGAFSQLILPEEIRQINPIMPITEPDAAKAPEATFTGLMVDARGLSVKTGLAPRVITETGEEVYGPTVISREYAVQKGVVTYAPNLAEAGKGGFAGENPLVVTGIGTAVGAPTDIIISSADAAKLRSDPTHTSFLSQCRVVIVLDPPTDSSPKS